MDISFDTGAQNMTLNDDESKLMDEISFQMPEKKTVPLKAKPSRPSPFAKRAPGPSRMEAAPEEGLDLFMNPSKRTAAPPPAPEEFDDGEGEEEYEGEDGQEQGQFQGGGASGPSDGYKTIEDEKADLLNKITRLTQKGFKSSARLTIYSDIDEIRTEYKRMIYSIEVDRSIKFQRRMLVACVTGLEFLNDKFDPFDLELNGWSQNTMESIEEYDGVFEDLYNKYKTKVQVAPEVKLIMMVGGSAMMFHLTNSMLKSATAQAQNGRPDMMQGLMNTFKPSMPSAGDPPSSGLQREMRGPGMDFGSLMSMMGPPPPQMARQRDVDVESVSDIVSIDAGDPDTREVNVGDGKKKARKSKKKEVVL